MLGGMKWNFGLKQMQLRMRKSRFGYKIVSFVLLSMGPDLTLRLQRPSPVLRLSLRHHH